MEFEDTDHFLQEIEKKYSECGTDDVTSTDKIKQQLRILSQEFDTLGLPSIDLQGSYFELLQAVMSNTFLLIQLHRKTLVHVKDVNISHISKDAKTCDLQNSISTLKTKLAEAVDQKSNLEHKFFKLISENEELSKKVALHNKETNKLKQYHKSKENQLLHQISKLENENHHLKEMCGKDLDKYFSKEEKFLAVLKTYKHKEEMYKTALQKLEDNNAEIMNEILNLKTELALAYVRND